MSDLNSVLSTGQSQTDALIESYKATQQSKVNTLNERKNLLQSRDSFYTTLNSRLNSLVEKIDEFTSKESKNKFLAKSVSSSDSNFVTATAESNALLGSNSLRVERLASNDVLVSDRMTLSTAFGETAGTKSFDITINSTTKQVNVTFDGTETNEQALKKIVNAINNTEDIEVNASYIKDTNSTGRITLSSASTGTDNRIIFSESSVLDKIGLNPDDLQISTQTRTVATDSTAGYKKADYQHLDSKFGIILILSF